MNLLFKILLLFIISQIYTQNLFSQKFASPLEPQEKPLVRHLGLYAGIGPNWQSGEYYVNCTDCIFEGGTGLLWTIGAMYEQEIAEGFRLGIMAGYENINQVSSFQEVEMIDFTIEGTGEIESYAVKFRHEATVDVGYLTFNPFIKWLPTEFFFLRLGLTGAIPMNPHLNHTQELLDKYIILSNGDTATVDFGDGQSKKITLEDGEFPNVNSFQLFIAPALGFEFQLSKTTFLSPVFQFNMPMTDFSSKGDAYRIWSWRFMAELRFALQKDKLQPKK